MVSRTCEIIAPDGRTLHVYDTDGAGEAGGTVVIWHHGPPQTREPPVPLVPELGRRGIRCVSYDRPGYGGGARAPARDGPAPAAALGGGCAGARLAPVADG